MVVAFPRDLVLEAYLGRWVDITALPQGRGLRQEDPVVVQWGAKSETLGKLPPSTVEGVLNNVGGHWTPDNVMGDYWAYLQGRNVPMRLALRVMRDTFNNRTLPTTWGSTETGDNWTPDGGTYAVGSGVGTHTVSTANTFQVITIGDSYEDCQIACSWTATSTSNVTGGAIEPLNLVLRYQGGGSPMPGRHYLLRVSVDTSEVLTAAIYDSQNGALTSPVSFGVINPAAPVVRAKFQIEGQTLRAKLYPIGPVGDLDRFEPLGWHLSAHDATLSGGFAGIRTGLASGNTNTPVTFSYDDWEMRLLRHTGELADLKPSWDESHRIKKAGFKSADITQRLGRPNRPALASAPRRYLGSNFEFTTTDHWPLDEPANAPAPGLNAVPGGAPARFERLSGVPDKGTVTWGQTDDLLNSVDRFVALNSAGKLIFTVNSAPLTLGWSVMFAIKRPLDAVTTISLATGITPGGAPFQYLLKIFTDGGYDLSGVTAGPVISLASGELNSNAVAGNWATLGVTIFFNGGTDVGFHINRDGQALGIGNWVGGDGYSPLTRIQWSVGTMFGQNSGPDGYLSNLFVTAAPFYTNIGGITVGTKASNALKGWPGEKAGNRAFRLTAEEGVLFDYYADTPLGGGNPIGLGETRPMGAQRPIPLLDQLQECADADQGILYAPRYSAGIGFRTRRSMCAQPVATTLSYSGGMVAPQLAPAADDSFTANLVRAERVDGGFLVLEQASGPMNTKDPQVDPEAIGESPGRAVGNLESEAQLGDLGGWTRALGTVPEVRYPSVRVNLRAAQVTEAAQRSVLAAHVGDRLLITGLQAADIYRDLDQIVRGGKEVYGSVREHEVTFNTAPYEKYRAGVFGDSASRYDGAVTTLDAQLNAGVTGGRAVTTTAGQVWTTAAGAFPMDVLIGGERVTLSGITGAGATQTMTISARAVNGAAKTHPAGTRVYLFQPVYYC